MLGLIRLSHNICWEIVLANFLYIDIVLLHALTCTHAALVNKGCAVFSRGDVEKGRDYFQEALNVEATCTEALYNLGLAYKKTNRLTEAMDCFVKLHSILKSSSHVLYHLADLHDRMDDFEQATET